MTRDQAIRFVRQHGIVLEAGRGSVPSLAEEVVGARIRGSWWGHPRGKEIFSLTRAVRAAPDVLVCRLVGGKVTYVHRRLWPALVRLAGRFPRSRLAAVREVHTGRGSHVVERTPFPHWVPAAVRAAAARLEPADARTRLVRAGFRF